MIRAAPTIAHATHGFSPMLSFQLADIEAACFKAKEEYQCELDGEIATDEYIKVACLRTACGISLSF